MPEQLQCYLKLRSSKYFERKNIYRFNRPSVAGAVLKSPQSFIDSLTDSMTDPLVQISSKHCLTKSEELGGWNLRKCSSHTMCCVSGVTCHVLWVKYVFVFHIFSNLKKNEQSGWTGQ